VVDALAYEESAGGGDKDIAAGSVVSRRHCSGLSGCSYPYSWGMDAMTDMITGVLKGR
jgi:hypothetical protein